MHSRKLVRATGFLAQSYVSRTVTIVSSTAHFSTSCRRPAGFDFTHAVIGGGAIGLAVARQLVLSHPSDSTILLERHGLVGSETSSRNSEVIHAGLYYPPSSLKARLCIRGKEMLYELCRETGIGHKRCGKWIVAQDGEQYRQLEGIHKRATELEVPVKWVASEELRRREVEEGVRARAGALESPTTGIVDSHGYMQFLEGDFLERGGMEILGTAVDRVEKLVGGGYRIYTRGHEASISNSEREETADGEDAGSIDVEVLINAAGLDAIPLWNSIARAEKRIQPHYAKGTYFSYASRRPHPTILVYPAPQPGLGGLGTHLTLDLSGRVRFGPDVEWIESPSSPGALTPSADRLSEATEAIKAYLPDVDEDKIEVDYCGIRPKLAGQGAGFQDFYIREEGDEELQGFVNLLGIESPGLTASLAIAEYVERLLYGSQAHDPTTDSRKQ